MSQNIMDRYYRAAKSFGQQLEDTQLPATEEEKKLRDLFGRSGIETEKLLSVYFDVTIDEEWIEHIEAALPHLEAAIREDRQFIKTEGNVTPIERVRKVSRTSVEHLSRHSEMITHVPEEGEDLIPDKLNVFENESNYAVYENRVLYMVLCYTRDFVDYRYYKIAQAWKECRSEMEFVKSIQTEGGPITVQYRYSDGTNGPDALEGHDASKVKRLEAIAAEVSILLSMPLMKSVALEPMITPPITRTNVLRMDKHFKEVVALYDYLSSYTGEGFSLVRHENSMEPFSADMEKRVTELAMFGYFLNGQYGHNLSEELEKRYLEEEERRREAERRRNEARVREILGRAQEGNLSSEEYRALIVEEVELREQAVAEAERLRADAEAMRISVMNAGSRVTALQEAVAQGRADADNLRIQISATRKSGIEEAERLQNEVNAVAAKLAAEQERARVLEARIYGLMEQFGVKVPGVDLSEREQFLELEKEKEAFDRFFERNWGVAKKKIRRKILWKRG